MSDSDGGIGNDPLFAGERLDRSIDEAEIVDCIDSCLNHLGKGVAYTVYLNWSAVDRKRHLGILCDPRSFRTSLYDLFGEEQGNLIEILMVRKLRERFPILRFESGITEESDFVSVINWLTRRARDDGDFPRIIENTKEIIAGRESNIAEAADSNQAKKAQNARTQLIKRIEKGLDQFGMTTKGVVFWHLETKYDLPREAILEHPKEFVQSIREMFGASSRAIEQEIVQEINASPEFADFNCSDLLTALNRAEVYCERRG